MLALILHHPYLHRNGLPRKYDRTSNFWVKPVKVRIYSSESLDRRRTLLLSHQGSLIVTPTSLQQQWIEEIESHAPTLRLLVYEGWSKLRLPTQRTVTFASSNSMHKRKASGSLYTDERVMEWFDYAQVFDVILTTCEGSKYWCIVPSC